MVRRDAADKAREHIADAVARGGRPLIDEAHFRHQGQGRAYLAPQALVEVDHSMLVMTEETFAPVVGIMKVKGR
jgi:acyl-CoA reductase-like NAD-dependent aldehyde dehydrogenase